MRRIITKVSDDGISEVLLDGPPSGELSFGELGGLYDLWEVKNIQDRLYCHSRDCGPQQVGLKPPQGGLKVRYFDLSPHKGKIPAQSLSAMAEVAFARMGAEDCLTGTERHPCMHVTRSLDVVVLLKGEASLILDETEVRIHPGDVVIQQATRHSWVAHGEENAMFVVVLIGASSLP